MMNICASAASFASTLSSALGNLRLKSQSLTRGRRDVLYQTKQRICHISHQNQRMKPRGNQQTKTRDRRKGN